MASTHGLSPTVGLSRLRLASLSLVALAATLLSLPVVAPAIAVTTVGPGVDQIIRATNDYRVSQGRARLAHHTGLTDMAQAWADQMAADYNALMVSNSRDYSLDVAFRHNPNLGAQVGTATGGATAWGENIAWNLNYPSPYSQMVTQWIESPGHRTNMINASYTHIGVGVARANDGSYFGVQVFARTGASNPPAPGTLIVEVNAIGASGSTPGCVELYRQNGASYTEVADYCVTVTNPVTTVRFSDIPPGTYTVRMYNFAPLGAVYLGGTVQPSATVTVAAGATSTVFLPVTPAVTRVGGASRYHTAVEVSKEFFPTGASTVYLAAGTNFPDALSAAPAAASVDAPLLLIEPSGIPAVVWDELVRLDPDEIFVAGGPAVMSESVLVQLRTLAPTTRLSGSDRYATSRSVIRNAFEDAGSTVAYVAAGHNFPDALSASAAAGTVDAPVILVNGLSRTLDPQTVQLLQDLGVTEIRIAGGPAAVHPDLQTALGNVPGVTSVTRLGGADRYVVSGVINRAAFDDADTVFVASGLNFPDALAGAAVAGASDAPLYVIPPSCMPSHVLEDVFGFGATTVVVLGGTASVSPSAAAFTRCP